MDNMRRFLEKLQRREIMLGTHIGSNDSQLTEMIANVGFDYLWIDTEHTAVGNYAVLLHLIASRAAATPAFVRIPWNDTVLAKPVLELGVQGIIFPMIKTAGDAEYAVRSCLYPPEGIRGYGPRRAIKFGLDSAVEYIKTDSRELLKILQIETKEAVENIDEIARVPGVDILALGPADLSGAYGKLLQFTDPEMQKIYRYVVERIHKAGKPAMVSNGVYTYENLKMWIGLGLDLVTTGSEPAYIINGAKCAKENFIKAAKESGRLPF